MAPGSSTLRGALVALTLTLVLAAAPAAQAVVDVRHVSTTATETSLVSNNDGILAPGETFQLTERLKNFEAGTLHDVHGSLAYAGGNVVVEAVGDPLVTLTQTESDYGDMPAGSEANNFDLYRGQIAPEAGCGEVLDFNLNVTSVEGNKTVPFKVMTGVPGPAFPFDSSDVPQSIGDFQTVDSGLETVGGGWVSGLDVRLGDLTHSSTGDLKIELIAPDGASIVLVDHRGGTADDFSNVTFSDDAAESITTATAPFNGTYRPEQALSNLAGHKISGLWRLRVSDTGTGDTGTLDAWGLDIRRAICDGSPAPSFTAAPDPVLPGNPVTLDGSGSVDPNGTIVQYEWDFDNDGTTDYTSADPSDKTAVHTFATRGKYPVKLTVTDNSSVVRSITQNVSVTQPPVADLDATPTNPLSQTSVTLDASGSSDPDFPGSPLDNYEWDLDGDGSFETDTDNVANTSHTYDTPGLRTVRVRVTDVDGATAVASVGVDVQNRPPTADFTIPNPAVVGTSASFDAGASTDADGTVETYEWDFDNDGNFAEDTADSSVATATHTFNSPGNAQVTLRVTDDFGGVTTLPKTVVVTTAPVAAFTATANPTSLHVPVQFDGSSSVDPDGAPIANYEWDLDGNGSYETDTDATPTTSHAYNVNGTVTVKLRVTDAAGATGTHTLDVVAQNHAPVAAVVATPATVTAGTPTLLDARGSVDDDGTLVKYDWDLDGNGSFETTSMSSPTRSHTYPNPGTFNVGVRVLDNDGGTDTERVMVTVKPEDTTGGGSAGGGDSTGGDGGDGSAGSGGAGGGSGEPGTDGLRAVLTGTPIQRLRVVLHRGLIVGCRADEHFTCLLKAELRASDARRLGLRARARKPIVIGTLRIVLGASGHSLGRLKLSAAGRRSLRRARSLSLVVRGTVTGPTGKVSLRRSFLLRG